METVEKLSISFMMAGLVVLVGGAFVYPKLTSETAKPKPRTTVPHLHK